MAIQNKYWFLLSYMVQQPGLWTPHSVVVGSETLELTVPQLINLKAAHKVPDASVLMAVSHLGWMSEKAINGQPDIDPPTVISDAYRQGMVAALRINEFDTRQPMNPFSAVGEDPAQMAQANEWQEGFSAARRAKADTTTSVPQMEIPESVQPIGEKASGVTRPEKSVKLQK